MLDVKDVRFSYHGAQETDFVFNLKAKPEEILVVEGPSGVGKSTLLHLVAGLLDPHSGQIRWQDQDLVGLKPAERPLSMIFQSGNLFDHLTCRQNVAIGLNPHLKLDDYLWTKVDEAMEVLSIGQLSDQYPTIPLAVSNSALPWQEPLSGPIVKTVTCCCWMSRSAPLMTSHGMTVFKLY